MSLLSLLSQNYDPSAQPRQPRLTLGISFWLPRNLMATIPSPPLSRITTTQAPRAIEYLAERSLPILAVILALAIAKPFFRKGEQAEFIQCYQRAASRMLAGEPIHRLEPVAYTYPPAMALLTTPLAGLSAQGALAAWFAVNLAAMCAAGLCAWQLCGAPAVVPAPRPWPAILWLAVLFDVRYFLTPLENTQFDLVIAALLFGGGVQLRRGRNVWGGLLLGAAAACKCTPLLCAPWLLWRGRWRAFLAFVFAAAALSLAPDYLFPQTSGRSYLGDWQRTVLGNVAQSEAGRWNFSDPLMNQSLGGLLNRIGHDGPLVQASAIESLSAAPLDARTGEIVRWSYRLLAAALLGVTVWRLGRPRWRSQPPDDDQSFAWELAAGLCLMLILSPMSSKAHFTVLALPGLLAAKWCVERPHWSRWALAGILLLSGPLCARDLLGDGLGNLALYWGLTLWHAVALLVLCWSQIGGSATPRTAAAHSP